MHSLLLLPPAAAALLRMPQLHCKQWLCSARNKLWWMTPEWGKTARELPPETQVGGRGCMRGCSIWLQMVQARFFTSASALLAFPVHVQRPPGCCCVAQFMLLELEDGTYAMMLPLISHNTFRGTLRPPRQAPACRPLHALLPSCELWGYRGSVWYRRRNCCQSQLRNRIGKSAAAQFLACLLRSVLAAPAA